MGLRLARWLKLGAALVGVAMVLTFWFTRQWTRALELRVDRERLPNSARIASLWCNDDATRVVAVGGGSDVFERISELGATVGEWRMLQSGAHEELYAVDGGEGPWRGHLWSLSDERQVRVFAVGMRGTVLDCTRASCKAIQTKTDHALRAVAVRGGQAVIVGDGGTILLVNPDPTAHVDIPRDSVVVLPQTVDSLSADLRSVLLECKDDDGLQDCLAIAVGDQGTVVEGRGVGRCDEGHRLSGSSGDHCSWSWTRSSIGESVDLIAVWRDDRGIVAARKTSGILRRTSDGSWQEEEGVGFAARAGIWSPIHLVERKAWSHRETSFSAFVIVGASVAARAEGAWLQVGSGPKVVAASAPRLAPGAIAFLVDERGDVYTAR